jgi:hypothetical protein
MERKFAQADVVLDGAAPLRSLRAEVRKLYRQFQRLA